MQQCGYSCWGYKRAKCGCKNAAAIESPLGSGMGAIPGSASIAKTQSLLGK